MSEHSKYFNLAIISVFVAIMLLLSFSPLGMISFGLVTITLAHIPVIAASIVLGPHIGSLLGVFFGIISLIHSTIFPTALSFVFTPFINVPGSEYGSPLSIIICFLPRLLMGITPYYFYKLIHKNSVTVSSEIAGAIGSLTNTILVLIFIYVFFASDYSAYMNTDKSIFLLSLLQISLINGVPELILCAILTSAISVNLIKLKKRA